MFHDNYEIVRRCTFLSVIVKLKRMLAFVMKKIVELLTFN